MPETINSREITDEVRDSYLDYAMSVIVARALPDVRDGFKPVHRRILYAMHELGLRPNARFRKTATVVGEVLGKYHPHGDIAIYDALARLTQPWALRYPLIAGQGNFGSIDGDSPAAMRYTEAKLAPIADEMLRDIDQDTVRFAPNYDNTRQEPMVFPSALPNLLANGTVGIAVGMATNIPPHNLGELVDALIHLAAQPHATVEDLLHFVKGPDFPTGGYVYGAQDIAQAYASGKGAFVTRAKAEIEERKSGEFRIIVTEIPYQVNKSSLLEEIAAGVKEKRLEGIRDLRDESDKDGIRVVIELKRDAYPKKVLNQLFASTALQRTFHLNMLALVDGIQPRVLTLKGALEGYLAHRKVVVTRRSEFELMRAKERAHILEGLKKALDHITEVIATIKASPTKEEAHDRLMKKFRLSDAQSSAILEMRLQTLAGLERKKVENELTEKRKRIAELEDLLRSPKKILGVVVEEFKALRAKYADERRTVVIPQPIGEFSQEDLVPDEDTMITVTAGGYVKRLPIDAYRVQGRGGKGVIGMATREEDTVEELIVTRTHADILFFTNSGKVFATKAYELPLGSRTAKGQALQNFLSLGPAEKVTAILALPKGTKAQFLIMTTRQGTVKKVPIDDFTHVRRSGLIAIRLGDGDRLDWVVPSYGHDDLMLVTAKGQSIRFRETDVRPMGRPAAGVRGIRLKRGDEIIGMAVIPKELKDKEAHVLVLSEHGFGKRTLLAAYKIQRRGGSGIKTANVAAKTGPVVGMALVPVTAEKDATIIVTSAKGQVIRVPLGSVSILGRSTQGVRVMRLDSGDSVATFTTFATAGRKAE
jgi:DNA gyrase subunit A